MRAADVAGMVVGAALGFVLVAIPFIYITGLAPRRILSLEARLFRLFKKRKKWGFTEIEQGLFLGSVPRWPEHLAELRMRGVGAVLTLNETWELPMSVRCMQEECGMIVRQLPTPDFFAVSQVDLVEAVAFITKHLQEGRGVYVHCNGGKGRSSMCVLCYLVYTRGMSPDEALQMVRSKRKIAHLKALCGIRTQWRGILRFQRELEATRRVLADGGKGPPPVAIVPARQTQVVPQEMVAGAASAHVAPPQAAQPAGAASRGVEDAPQVSLQSSLQKSEPALQKGESMRIEEASERGNRPVVLPRIAPGAAAAPAPGLVHGPGPSRPYAPVTPPALVAVASSS